MNFLLYSNLVFLFVSSVTLGISFGDKFDFVFFEFIFSVASMEVPPDPTEIAAGVAFERHHNSVVQIIGIHKKTGVANQERISWQRVYHWEKGESHTNMLSANM